jgi:hypothetical protein
MNVFAKISLRLYLVATWQKKLDDGYLNIDEFLIVFEISLFENKVHREH